MMSTSIGFTNKGHSYLCDIEDKNFIEESGPWYKDSRGYLARGEYDDTGKHMIILMHRALFDSIPDGYEVHHINGNKTDNRKCNLRLELKSKHMRNHKIKERKNSTGFIGVTHSGSKSKPFKAQIRIDGNQIYFGCFKTAEEASIVYKNKSKELLQ